MENKNNMDNISWLAGIIEGEGCFYLNRKKYMSIVVTMTDIDIIERIASIFVSKINGPYKNGNGKPLFTTQVHGGKALRWMKILLPMMGQRRSAKIKEILETGTKPPGPPRMCMYHPLVPHIAHDLCWRCYKRKSRGSKLVG